MPISIPRRDSFFSLPPRIGRIRRICWWILGARQKHQKPLAVDTRCLLRAIDVAAARKSSSKLGYFQPPPPSPLQGLCIHRKAINKDKPSCPLAYCPPGRCFTMSYTRGRCPRLLKVVPSRHRSACGSPIRGRTIQQDRGLSLFIALRWMQEPGGGDDGGG